MILLRRLGAAVELLGHVADRRVHAERDLDRLLRVGREVDLARVAVRLARRALDERRVLVAHAAAVRADGVPRQRQQAGARRVQRDAQQILLGELPHARALADLDAMEIRVVAGADPVDQRVDAPRAAGPSATQLRRAACRRRALGLDRSAAAAAASARRGAGDRAAAASAGQRRGGTRVLERRKAEAQRGGAERAARRPRRSRDRAACRSRSARGDGSRTSPS